MSLQLPFVNTAEPLTTIPHSCSSLHGGESLCTLGFLFLRPFFKYIKKIQRQMATLVLCVRWWKQTLQLQGTLAIFLVGHCFTVKNYASAQLCTNQWCKAVDKCYQISIQLHYTCFLEQISVMIMTVLCTSSHSGSILSAQNARTFKVHAASGS